MSIIVSNNNKQNLFAVFCLLFAAACWGVIWYPYRLLAEAGISGIASSFYTYGIAMLVGAIIFIRCCRGVLLLPKRAYLLCLIAGWTNLCFVLAMIDGEVMRIMLLFYLSPLWTLILARFWLKEPLHARGLLAIAFSLLGALIMLNDFNRLSFPLPQNKAEWLGLSAGIGFSMGNVFTRHASYLSLEAKSMLVWVGVVVVSLFLMPVFGERIPLPNTFSIQDGWVMVVIAVMLLLATITVQYGVTHISAMRASVLLVFELVVAAIASYFLAHEAMAWNEWVGGILIVTAGLISAMQNNQPKT